MTKTQMTLAAAAVLGSLALGAGTASAAPAGISVGSAPVSWVMMSRHKKMMMHKKMMHRKMMHKKMMMKKM